MNYYKSKFRYLSRSRYLNITSPRSGWGGLFIVGAGRSGNTILRRGLMERSSIAIPPETYELGRIISVYLKHNSMGWSSIVKFALGVFEFHPEFRKTFKYSLHDLHSRLLSLPAEEHCLQVLLSEFYLEYMRKVGQIERAWGDKTPINTFHVFNICKVFPSAKFIWMIRNPVDVVSSYLKAGFYTKVDNALERWKYSNQLMLEFYSHYSEKVIPIRYEELVTDYDALVQSIIERCGLRFREECSQICFGDIECHQHHQNVLNPVSKSSIGKGETHLEPEVVALIKKNASRLSRKIEKCF